jgi:voltage-gated potassium channel Kch
MRLIMLAVTLGGIFILSALIGVLGSGLEMRLNKLRKGRSRVVESGHTVILGWSPQIFQILEKLATIRASRGKICIAILAEKDKVEMEDEIREKIGKHRNVSIVCRHGNPMDLDDLEIISPHESRAIIILATDWHYHDAEVIKTCLAIINNPRRRLEPYHIVGSLRNPVSQEIARLISASGETLLFQVDNLIAVITAKSCRQKGLSSVYEGLLEAGFYFKSEPTLVGKTFREALNCYDKSVVIGLMRANAEIVLNPPMETNLESGDQIIAISSTEPVLTSMAKIDLNESSDAVHLVLSAPRKPERTLILGWNIRGARIIEHMESYVVPGSMVRVVSEIGNPEPQIAAFAGKLTNQTLQYQRGEIFSRSLLESLDVRSYNHIVVLSYAPEIETQKADSIAMITLLHLRDIGKKSGAAFSIVSEIMDIRNLDLIQVSDMDEFIVSDRLVSLSLVKLAEDKRILSIFLSLLDINGPEILLKPVADYIRTDRPVNFYAILDAAQQRNETAIGYRTKAKGNEAIKQFDVVLNPTKSELIDLAADDQIIVVAEEL